MTRKQLIRYLSSRKQSAKLSLDSRYICRRERAAGKIKLIDDLMKMLGAKKCKERSC